MAVFFGHMGDGRTLNADEFAELFAEQVWGLRRTAFLLCGNWQRAEDLVQTTFAKVYAARGRVRARVTLPAYLRSTLTRTYIDESRRRWRAERPSEAPPDLPDRRHVDGQTEDRLVLLAALAALPARQRACLVLRFYEDCDVAETAALLGCADGTVKSNTARALSALRSHLAANGWERNGDGLPSTGSPPGASKDPFAAGLVRLKEAQP